MIWATEMSVLVPGCVFKWFGKGNRSGARRWNVLKPLVNTDVFVRFLLFDFLAIGRSAGMLWDLILGAFWVPLGSFLWFLWVLGMGWIFDVF